MKTFSFNKKPTNDKLFNKTSSNTLSKKRDNDSNDNDDLEQVSDTELEIHDNEEHNTKQDTEQSINLIIQHIERQKPTKKANISGGISSRSKDIIQSYNPNNNTLHDAIYAQHEVDIKIISKLKDKINSLATETNNLEKKLHYLRLDANNIKCDNDNYKKENNLQKIELRNALSRNILIEKAYIYQRFWFKIYASIAGFIMFVMFLSICFMY